jgi:hypothetical protein
MPRSYDDWLFDVGPWPSVEYPEEEDIESLPPELPEGVWRSTLEGNDTPRSLEELLLEVLGDLGGNYRY